MTIDEIRDDAGEGRGCLSKCVGRHSMERERTVVSGDPIN